MTSLLMYKSPVRFCQSVAFWQWHITRHDLNGTVFDGMFMLTTFFVFVHCSWWVLYPCPFFLLHDLNLDAVYSFIKLSLCWLCTLLSLIDIFSDSYMWQLCSLLLKWSMVCYWHSMQFASLFPLDCYLRDGTGLSVDFPVSLSVATLARKFWKMHSDLI